MEYKSKLKGIGIQFFADPPTEPPVEPPKQEPTAPPDPPTPKTYTQEEVNRMMANEKRQGRQSVMKELGLDPEDKDALKKAKGTLDSQKTQAQLDSEALKAEKDARSEAEKKAEQAERKFAVYASGCKKEFIDEVMALAAVKVNDSTDFDAALKAVKEKCPSFFEDDSDGGTGSGQGHKKQKTDKKPGSLGSSLAQSVVSSNPTTNPYFTKT